MSCPGGGSEAFYIIQGAGRGQLVGILLIGWWWGNQESASSIFWFQPSRVFVLVGRVVNFSHLVGISVCAKQLKDIVMCIPWGGTRTLPQGCVIVSWLLLPCLLFPLPSLINNCLNLPFGSQVRSWRLNEAYFLQQENRRHRTAFVPRIPTGSCSLSWTFTITSCVPNSEFSSLSLQPYILPVLVLRLWINWIPDWINRQRE